VSSGFAGLGQKLSRSKEIDAPEEKKLA
jgi:hypothetical protein